MFMMGQENEFQTDVCKKSYFKKLIDLFTFVIENIFLSFYITKLPQKKGNMKMKVLPSVIIGQTSHTSF